MVPQNKNIEDCSINEIVDCLASQPYGEAASRLIDIFETKPNTASFDWLRVSCVPYLFHAFEKMINSEDEPVRLFIKILTDLSLQIQELLSSSSFNELFVKASESYNWEDESNEVATKTGVHYGNLFKEFTLGQYLEAKNLLETRLSRNSINLGNLSNSTLLDQGCGGGRYTVAWKLLGVSQATGLDISQIGIEDAKYKTDQLGIDKINWIQGSVLEMPFADESFDMVYSNGVLHHTTDWQKGIKEQLRVLREGGRGWQYLIEAPGGIFWDKIEILRAILRGVNKNFAAKVLTTFGISKNRIFYMLDHVMVPINTRLTPDQIEECLTYYGAKKVVRLKRGTDFDRVEYIHRKIPYANIKFGVGENRYVFSK